MITDGGRVAAAIATLRTASPDIAKLDSLLKCVEGVTGISDWEWLYEVFRTGAASTPEEAIRLYNLEWEENYKPFI